MNELTPYNKFGLFSVIVAFLWHPLNVWYIHLDAGGRLQFLLLLISICLNWKEIKKRSLLPVTLLYSGIAVYMLVNGYVKHSAATYNNNGYWVMFVNLIDPVLTMLLVVNCARKKFDKTLGILMIGFLIFCLMSLVNSTYSERGRLDAELNANEMALNGALTIAIMLILRIRNKLKYPFVLLIILPSLLIVQTSSRMGFFMALILFLFYCLLKLSHAKLRTRISGTILLCLAVVFGLFILNNTLLGERMMHTTYDAVETVGLETGTILDYFGDRGFQYYASWPLFVKNPIFGIGLNRWMIYNPTEHVCHSEILVQYLECGIVSFIPWCFFLYLLAKPLFKNIKKSDGVNKKTIYLMLGVLLAILFANTVIWSYNQKCVFIVYALIIAYPRIPRRTIKIIQNTSDVEIIKR